MIKQIAYIIKISFLSIGCLSKKTNIFFDYLFSCSFLSLALHLNYSPSLMNVKRDDAFISWLDGHEYTIVYCMSLRVAIERKKCCHCHNPK